MGVQEAALLPCATGHGHIMGIGGFHWGPNLFPSTEKAVQQTEEQCPSPRAALMPCGRPGDFVEVERGRPAKPRSPVLPPATEGSQDALGRPNAIPRLSPGPTGKTVRRLPQAPPAWGRLGAAAPSNLRWGKMMGTPQNRSHLPSPALIPAPSACTHLFPSVPCPPSCHRSCPPPHTGTATATYISTASFLGGE